MTAQQPTSSTSFETPNERHSPESVSFFPFFNLIFQITPRDAEERNAHPVESILGESERRRRRNSNRDKIRKHQKSLERQRRKLGEDYDTMEE